MEGEAQEKTKPQIELPSLCPGIPSEIPTDNWCLGKAILPPRSSLKSGGTRQPSCIVALRRREDDSLLLFNSCDKPLNILIECCTNGGDCEINSFQVGPKKEQMFKAEFTRLPGQTVGTVHVIDTFGVRNKAYVE